MQQRFDLILSQFLLQLRFVLDNEVALYNFINRQPFQVVYLQQPHQQLDQVSIQPLLKEHSLVKLLLHLLNCEAHIRRPAVQDFVEEDAQAPHIDVGGVALLEDDLRRHIGHRAANCPPLRAAVLKLGRPAEIAELDVELIVEKYVLGLDVAVGDPATLEVMDGHQELVKYLAGQSLGQAVVVVQIFEQRPSLRVFQQQIKTIALLDMAEQLDDAGVLDFRVDLYLPAHDLLAGFLKILQVDFLDREMLVVLRGVYFVDFAEGAPPNLSARVQLF